MTVLLYDNPVSGNCHKVRLILGLLGIEFERRELSVVDRSGRAEVLGGLSRAGAAVIAAMERHLADREYLVAGRFTIADISLYAYTHVAPEAGFDLAPYPALREWLERVGAQPGVVPIAGS